MLNKTMIPALALLSLLLATCGRTSPTEPAAPTFLPEGHYSSTAMCLDVTAASVQIVGGCGHGSFPRPLVNAEGTFTADGTFTVTFGPPSNTPTPAHFAGTVSGDTVTVTVTNAGPTGFKWQALRGSALPCPVACP
jgi:hypothetical protein